MMGRSRVAAAPLIRRHTACPSAPGRRSTTTAAGRAASSASAASATLAASTTVQDVPSTAPTPDRNAESPVRRMRGSDGICGNFSRLQQRRWSGFSRFRGATRTHSRAPEILHRSCSAPQADPLRAVLVVLALPDRRVLLQLLDRVPGGGEGVGAVGRGGGDHHRDRARVEASDPVVDGEPRPGPARPRLVLDAREHAQRHLGVRLVLEPHHRAAAVVRAHGADEGDHRPAVRSGHGGDRRVHRERPIGDAVRTGSARHRRDERHLRAVAQRPLGGRELLIDREPQPLHDRAQPGMRGARGLARVGGRRAVAQLHRLAGDPRPLPRRGEVEQGDAHPVLLDPDLDLDVSVQPDRSLYLLCTPRRSSLPTGAVFPRVRPSMADGGHNLGTVELLALLRDGSLKHDSIAEEMQCAGAHPCTAAQIAEARELLGLLRREQAAQSAGLAAEGAAAEPEVAGRISALPEPLALALVRAAGDAQRQEALVELAAAPQKALAKEAKRELQRLKQRGFQVQELRPRGEPVLKPPPEVEAPACYASSIDAYGERAVWWSRATRGGVEVVQAVVSDVKGILAIDALALSRRNFRDFTKRLPRQGGPVTSVEVTKDHARWLIAQAAEEGARNGFSPPPAYADALWILGEEALRSFALKVDEISVSRLFIDDAQRKAAFERAADDAAEAYFTPQRRARYARRLREMAHVLASEGRLDAARTALAVSRDLPGEQGPRNAFARALFSRALEGRWQKPAESPIPPATPSGLITP